MSYILFQDGAVIVDTHFNMRLRKGQKRIENAGPERDVKHDLYPVFLLDLKHINKGKILMMASTINVINHGYIGINCQFLKSQITNINFQIN